MRPAVKIYFDAQRNVYASVRKRRKGKIYKLFRLVGNDTMRRASRWKVIHIHKGEHMVYDLKHDVRYLKEKKPKKTRRAA